MPRGSIHEGATVTTDEPTPTISGNTGVEALTEPISVRMPLSLDRALEEIAQAESRSKASVIRHAARLYIQERAA